MHVTPEASFKTTGAVRLLRTLGDIRALERMAYEDLVPSRNVYELFQATAHLCGDRPALTMLGSADPVAIASTMTHRELLGEITRAANMFSSLGVSGDDVVTIVARVLPQVPALIWGAETAGVASSLNYLLSAEAILGLLRAEKAKVLVCPGPSVDAPLWNLLDGIIDQVPTIEAVVVIGGGPKVDARHHDLEALIARQPSDHLTKPRVIGRDTIAALFHTGGTTGLPKLVQQTHGNQVHAAWSFAQAFGFVETDVGLNGLPWFHVGGTSTWGLSILGAGGHILVLTPTGFRNPDVIEQYWRIVERFRATACGAIPTSIASLADVPVGEHDISSLRMAQTGGAVLPAPVAERFEKRVGVPLLEQYGMTESAATIASTLFYGDHVRGSVGFRCPFSDIRVVKIDKGGGVVDCAEGQIGSVICRGPQMFVGYVDPRHNQGAFTPDGWFITGDLGYFTPAGALVLTGREKDLIIRSGHNIDPAAIEAIANAHPSVGLSAAVGMPDGYAGEVPVIFVTPAAGKSVDPAEVSAFMQDRVPEPPARPRHVFVLDAIPVTAVGKVFKPALRDMAIREKIQMEVRAHGGGATVGGVVMDRRRGLQVTVTLVDPGGLERAAVEERLGKIFRDLQFNTTVKWE